MFASAERGSEVNYESVRLSCNKHVGFGDTFFFDRVFGTIHGQRNRLVSLDLHVVGRGA